MDAAGNVRFSAALSFTVDTIPPAAPVVLSPANLATVTDPTVVISGSAEAGNAVRVYLDRALAGTTTADEAGGWEFTPGAALTFGAHTATVEASDAAGNTSALSGVISFDLVQRSRFKSLYEGGCSVAPAGGFGAWLLLLVLRRSRSARSLIRRRPAPAAHPSRGR